ncbi:hypothetical protein LSH36_285g03067 [Paralvinella palmiformis]|uniref:Transporter n=1 Tax=Paralvinella palmiformis TaxID=53620 RepID=A0AAD9JKC3_9ANNE|nr:hypothetical protein LSH36_285g03067 [Paralvinella palmiformis]
MLEKTEVVKDTSNDVVSSCENSSESKLSRGKWGRQIEFLLSCIGYAVGLGNLWRFPYLCIRNGGGAFLVPYFLFLFLCGLPLFYMELILGQFSSLSPVSVWKLCPLFKGIGWGMLIVSGILCIYYNIIISWVLYYIGMSFRAEVPWKSCNNPWNTENCSRPVLDINETLSGSLANATHQGKTSPAEEFFHFKILNMSSGIDDLGGIQWQMLLCLLAAWTLVYICLCKGIKSSGKVVYVTATVPYLFLTILLIRGATLPGSLQGIKFYIIPDWKKLLEFEVWTEACLQIFYSLGPAWGGLITMASYNNFHNNCFRDALIVCLTCGGTSFYAGFVIFSIIGFMAFETGLPVGEVITQGPGLAFIAYPEAVARLPISPFWALCFFLMLLTLGLDSQIVFHLLIFKQFATLETLTSGFVDEFPRVLGKRKHLFTFFVCMIMFGLGLPLTTRGGIYIFQILDWYSAAFSVMVIGFTECIVVCYIYGIGHFFQDIQIMLFQRPSYVWAILWCFVTPAILLVILIVSVMQLSPPMYGNYVYPWWVQLIGWIIASLSIIPIPVMAVYKIITTKGSVYQIFSTLLRPEQDWGPSSEEYRVDYKVSHNWLERLSFRTVNILNPSQEVVTLKFVKVVKM